MRKIDEIFMFINAYSERDKEVIIKKVAKKFEISIDTAKTYYYRWKREYMKTSKCVPKDTKINLKPKQVNQEVLKKDELIKIKDNNKLKKQDAVVIKGECGIYIKEGNRVIAGDVIFNNSEDIENYRKKEIAVFYKRLSEIMDVMNLEV